MTHFAGRVALVTGASSGIGAGVAEALGAAGAVVAVNYPTAAEHAAAGAVVERITAAGGSALSVRADVSNEGDVADMVAAVCAAHERIDILVNNAGIATAAPVESMRTEDFDRLIAVHLRGLFLVTRAVLPGMYARDYGRIVNTASQLAYKGAPAFAHYTAAKGGIIGFTRSLALEAGERNVTANCVAPGATMTPMLEDVPGDVLEAIRASIPRGRLAEVADIVPSYLFLASEEAAHYRGQCLSPNGGDVFL